MAAMDQRSQEAIQLAAIQESLDTFWLLFSGVLVFFMQCGFGMLEAGAVKSRSTQNIMLKNLFDVALGGWLWWLVGYAFTNEGGSAFIGITPTGQHTQFALVDLSTKDHASGREWATVFFQFTFAAASATIVSGAVAERAMLPAYLFCSCVITGLIYPVVAHWVWSTSGWLSVSNPDAVGGGMIDFAGSGVVHMTGGVAAVVGATIIGPRVGRFDSITGAVVLMPGHSSVLQVLGTFILWMGWYGFNAGSTTLLNATAAGIAGRVVMTTTLAASTGGIACVVLERMRGARRQWDVVSMCNGILSGLVSVTAGCATVELWAAVLIGLVGACLYRLASTALLRRRIDDPLDAFAVHGACGCWGVLAAALFTAPRYSRDVAPLAAGKGLLYGGGQLLGVAALFVLAHLAWVGLLSCLVFGALRRLRLLRVSTEYEMAAQTSSQAAGAPTPWSGMQEAAGERLDGSTHGGKMYEGGLRASASIAPA